ncbi:hydroxypyruvate reductase [Edaphobacter acidisoli]|uniref:Hydroxypyruvate reductase n=2 Tax=Edaphobacter acidisoli TaxID=2040573 RepID=A0A916W572_9BACT|nr:DUF4147 domain-containing protein [Edaphobacter acidisoli]GGA66473.1 hydroxypyruvate reductase [Edaphobacter acidisoli]
MKAREEALGIFLSALRASRIGPAMGRCFHCDGTVLEIGDNRYQTTEYERLVLIAIGKAAGSMSTAFLDQTSTIAERFEGIIAGHPSEEPLPARFRKYRGGHPTPNEASIAAAEDTLRTLESLTERDLVVFLISGGGSAMVEQFLLTSASLDVVIETHKALVECGAPITQINVVRKHLSAVKGGRLAAAAAPAEQVTVFVSDVPAGELDALSSGPTMPDRSTMDDVYQIANRYELAKRLPAPVAGLLESHALTETPKLGDITFERSQWVVLLDSACLEHAAAVQARELGWHVEVDNTCDDWSTERAAEHLLHRLREMRSARERVCLLSAGEVTVCVPSSVKGNGGRNQHFALLCSEKIADSDIVVLSGGSDGIDGNSEAAGAIVDGTTVSRADVVGFPVNRALQEFNSGALLALLGDNITTGPTGNNLRDLRILLAP